MLYSRNMTTPPSNSHQKKKKIKLTLIFAILTLTTLTIVVVTYFFQNFHLFGNTQLLDLISVILSVTGAGMTLLFVPQFLSKNTSSINRTYNSQNGRRRLKFRRINPTRDSEPLAKIILTLKPLQDNMQNHIIKLQNNSIVNLIIGIIGTIMAVTVLSLAINTGNEYKSLEIFALNFLPRISFVILIQLFAFFFLRLYKSNLEDSKYFQNELTNILAKTTAIKIASQQDDKPLLTELIRDLSKIERNFKLATGETLLNLEKAKIEKDVDLALASTVRDFFKNFKTKE